MSSFTVFRFPALKTKKSHFYSSHLASCLFTFFFSLRVQRREKGPRESPQSVRARRTCLAVAPLQSPRSNIVYRRPSATARCLFSPHNANVATTLIDHPFRRHLRHRFCLRKKRYGVNNFSSFIFTSILNGDNCVLLTNLKNLLN